MGIYDKGGPVTPPDDWAGSWSAWQSKYRREHPEEFPPRPTQTNKERIVAAIALIEGRGEKVSARKVADVAGLYVSPYSGLNGRDSAAYRDAMLAAGYSLVQHGKTERYEKVPS